MLPKSNIDIALPTAEYFAGKNQSIVPKTNGVLDCLVGKLSGLNPSFLTLDDNILTCAGIPESLVGAEDSFYARDLAVTINDLSKIVSGHVSFARNVVKPEVTAFAIELNNYRSRTAPKESSAAFSVIQLEKPLILDDISFLGLLEKYNDRSVIEPDNNLTLGVKSDAELLAYVSLGNDRINRLIVEWVSSLPANYLQAIWASTFTVQDNTPNLPCIATTNAYDAMNYALAVFLIASKLRTAVDSESGLSLAKYNIVVDQYITYAGSMLVKNIALVDSLRKTNTMVIRNDSRNKTVSVDADMYRDWLASGGSPDILLGALVSNSSFSSVSELVNNKEKLLSSWRSYCVFDDARLKNKALIEYRDSIYNLFQAAFSINGPEETQALDNRAGLRDSINTRVQNEIATLTHADLDDSDSVALRIMAKCRFFYSSAYDILTDMISVSKQNQGLDAKEAGLLAVVNYLISYLGSQVKVC